MHDNNAKEFQKLNKVPALIELILHYVCISIASTIKTSYNIMERRTITINRNIFREAIRPILRHYRTSTKIF